MDFLPYDALIFVEKSPNVALAASDVEPNENKP